MLFIYFFTMNKYSNKEAQIYKNHSALYYTPKTNKHNLLIKNINDPFRDLNEFLLAH